MTLPAIRILQPIVWVGAAWSIYQLRHTAESWPAVSIILIYLLVLFQISLKCSHCKRPLTGYRRKDHMRDIKPHYYILVPSKCRHCGHEVIKATLKIR